MNIRQRESRWEDTVPVKRNAENKDEGDEHKGPSPFFLWAISVIAGCAALFCFAQMLKG